MLVCRSRLPRRKNVSGQKLLAQILDDHLACARGVGLLDHCLNVVGLAHIADHRDDAVIVVLLEPWNDDGGIESSGVGEHNFFRHEHSLRAGDRHRPAVNKESLSVLEAGFPPARKSMTARNPSPRLSLPIRGAPAVSARTPHRARLPPSILHSPGTPDNASSPLRSPIPAP